MNQAAGSDGADGWLSADAACALMGIKRATLYAYASRGKVRSRAGAEARSRCYARADLEQLAARRDARAGHGAVAAAALRWGEPVVDSAITEIRREGHRYRGRDAIELARAHSFERVAELLWESSQMEMGCSQLGWEAPNFDAMRLARLIDRGSAPLDAMMLAVAALALRDDARLAVTRDGSIALARRLIRSLIAAAALPFGAVRARRSLREKRCSRAFAVAMGTRHAGAIEQALVLLADHELNSSSFAARVAASTGADLYACVAAALATLSGPRHGGMVARVEALIDEIARPERAARVVGERLRRGDGIPGFGHPLYPEGDPRFPPLLEAARRAGRTSRRLRTLEALVATMELVGGEKPTVDLALSAIAAALRFPAGGSAALFAAARAAGWIAHALEQRDAGFMMRPRARYTGQ
ncbi:MAG TPA: citrate synthase [Polyangiaceae bacterium]|nr:citrate synthase [Polyangiaceae bacterium]